MMQQTTLLEPVRIPGTGLHRGKTVSLNLRPAPANTGIRFIVVDRDAIEIPAHLQYVCDTQRATSLGVGSVCIATVEHLLAALFGCGIDNLLIEVEGQEIPLCDGSAAPFVAAIDQAGIAQLDGVREPLRISRKMAWSEGHRKAWAEPYHGFRLRYRVDFSERGLPCSERTIELTPHTFRTELAAARTFGFRDEIEPLRAAGRIRGATLRNALVFDGAEPINPPLRFPDEPVRHKLLDLVGDVALIGHPIRGSLTVHHGGHQFHHRIATDLLACGLVPEKRE